MIGYEILSAWPGHICPSFIEQQKVITSITTSRSRLSERTTSAARTFSEEFRNPLNGIVGLAFPFAGIHHTFILDIKLTNWLQPIYDDENRTTLHNHLCELK